jgi:ABC-type siderophore export system fused ATPase/permease subunit
MLLAVAATVSQVPIVYSPVITFALTSKALNTTTTFVLLSYLTLMATPLMTLFQKLPQLLGALTCLQPIQDFLERPPRTDFRVVRSGPAHHTSARPFSHHNLEMQNIHTRAEWAIKITEGYFS